MRLFYISSFLLMFFSVVIGTTDINAQAIDSELKELLKESYIPGISLTTIKNGKISDSFYLGYKSIDSKSQITSRTVFSAASLSKCVFGYIVMQLSHDGIINLDTPLNDYFIYEDINHDERAAIVTARMVLSHTTGLPNWRNGKLEFRDDPGNKYGYSGEGYVWLQRVVEHITGSDLESLAQKMVFEPLKMDRTSYFFLDRFEDDYALPHDNMLRTNSKFKIKEANAAHSLQTTSSDYAKFMISILKKDYSLMYDAQINVNENSEGKISWGLGVGIQLTTSGREFWHWGDNGTFKAYFTIDPKSGDGLVYFANGSNGLSCTAEITKLFLQSPQPSVNWNDYTHYKSPQFQFPLIAEKVGIVEAMKLFLTKEGKIDTTKVSFRTAGWIAWQWLQARELDLAGPLLKVLNASNPDDARIPYNLARYHLMEGSVNKAVETCEGGIKSFTDDDRLKKLLSSLTNPSQAGIEFSLPGYRNAKMVSIVGPFNEWSDTANLCRWVDGAWRCYIDLEPGEYEYKFRIDGVNILDSNNEISRYKGNLHVSLRIIE